MYASPFKPRATLAAMASAKDVKLFGSVHAFSLNWIYLLGDHTFALSLMNNQYTLPRLATCHAGCDGQCQGCFVVVFFSIDNAGNC